MGTRVLSTGGYRYIPAVSQYSGGVAAEAGFRIERARFSRVVPLREGFDLIEKHITSLGRPTSAFCACELRSPAPFTEAGFKAFNEIYVGTLKRWGVIQGEENPVARSNVCPELDPPAEPGFYAFSYTVVDADAAPSFVVAGSAEAPEGKGDYRENAIARDDTSPAGILTKAKWVHAEMERRMQLLGFDWNSVTATQLYTVHDAHPFIGEELVSRGAMRPGLTWHFVRPPIVGLEYEMDCRGIPVERVINV